MEGGFAAHGQAQVVRFSSGLDLVQLPEDQAIDPVDHVDADVVMLRWFLFAR